MAAPSRLGAVRAHPLTAVIGRATGEPQNPALVELLAGCAARSYPSLSFAHMVPPSFAEA